MAETTMTPEAKAVAQRALDAHLRASDAGPVQVVQASLQDVVAQAVAEATRLEAAELHARVEALRGDVSPARWDRLPQWKSTAEVWRKHLNEVARYLASAADLRRYVAQVAALTPETLTRAGASGGGWGVQQRKVIEPLLGNAAAVVALLARIEEGHALMLQRATASGAYVAPVAGPAPMAASTPRAGYAASATREP